MLDDQSTAASLPLTPDSAAGLPASDGRMYCPTYSNATSCYYLNTAQASFAAQQTNCAAMRGHLVAYNNAFEQLDVERYFTAAGTMTTSDYIYIGVEKSGPYFYLADGRLLRNIC